MDVDGDRVDAEMASDSEADNSSDDERKEEELNKKKQALQNRVSVPIKNNYQYIIRRIFRRLLCNVRQIEADKTDYAAYEELIQVLSSLGDLDELRNVREKLSKECPLSPRKFFIAVSTACLKLPCINILFEYRIMVSVDRR